MHKRMIFFNVNEYNKLLLKYIRNQVIIITTIDSVRRLIFYLVFDGFIFPNSDTTIPPFFMVSCSSLCTHAKRMFFCSLFAHRQLITLC
jgi:hypothetical protein